MRNLIDILEEISGSESKNPDNSPDRQDHRSDGARLTGPGAKASRTKREPNTSAAVLGREKRLR
jgi:hypothetical protein